MSFKHAILPANSYMILLLLNLCDERRYSLLITWIHLYKSAIFSKCMSYRKQNSARNLCTICSINMSDSEGSGLSRTSMVCLQRVILNLFSVISLGNLLIWHSFTGIFYIVSSDPTTCHLETLVLSHHHMVYRVT